MRNYNHRRSSYKIWSQEGRLIRQTVVIFPSFSKKPDVGSCQNTKIDTFFGQIPQKFDPRFLPNFPGDPNVFFKILTTGTKGSIVPKSEGVPDVRD